MSNNYCRPIKATIKKSSNSITNYFASSDVSKTKRSRPTDATTEDENISEGNSESTTRGNETSHSGTSETPRQANHSTPKDIGKYKSSCILID